MDALSDIKVRRQYLHDLNRYIRILEAISKDRIFRGGLKTKYAIELLKYQRQILAQDYIINKYKNSFDIEEDELREKQFYQIIKKKQFNQWHKQWVQNYIRYYKMKRQQLQAEIAAKKDCILSKTLHDQSYCLLKKGIDLEYDLYGYEGELTDEIEITEIVILLLNTIIDALIVDKIILSMKVIANERIIEIFANVKENISYNWLNESSLKNMLDRYDAVMQIDCKKHVLSVTVGIELL